MQFLVIGRITARTNIEQVLPFVKPEAAKAWELYASNHLRSIHYIADKSGAVLLFEANNFRRKSTQWLLSYQWHKRESCNFEVIPLLPYTGTEALFRQLAIS